MRITIVLTLLSSILISCSNTEARKPIVRKTSSFMSESIERNKVLSQAENALFEKKMKIDSTREYFNSERGFWYSYDEKAGPDAPIASEGDQVLYTYEVMDLTGGVIFSKEEIGTLTYQVDKQELISGLQDGLKLMRQGETMTFLFPSHKAYGYTGSERIAPNQPLVYKVELIQVNKTPSSDDGGNKD